MNNQQSNIETMPFREEDDAVVLFLRSRKSNVVPIFEKPGQPRGIHIVLPSRDPDTPLRYSRGAE